MSFTLRSNLLRMVGNDAVAYKIAHAFIGDDQEKFETFQMAWQEQQTTGMEARSAAATEVAKHRWEIMFPAA